MNSATLPTMDFPANLSHWTAWIDAVSVVAVAVGVVKAFDWLDGLISDKSRVALWYYMADVPSDSTIDSWGDVFPNLIDKVFGKRALSWAFIFRSCLASLVACVCLSLAFIVAGAYNNIRLGDDSLVDVLIYFVMGLIYTLVGDYFSLLISRAVLHQMAGLRKFPDIMSLAI